MSPRRNWDSPTPPLASECAPPPGTKGGGGHNRLRVRGGGVPVPATGEKLSNLPTLCIHPSANFLSHKKNKVKLILNYLYSTNYTCIYTAFTFVLLNTCSSFIPRYLCIIISTLKILSSQKRGGFRGVPFEPFRLPTPSLMFFLNT
jgi:hypothetical protein